MAKKTYYTIYQGNDKTIPVLIVDESTGEPVEDAVLTGLLSADYGVFEITNDADTDPNEPPQVITKALGPNITVDAANATVTIFLVPADTEDLTPGKYYHELKLILANGKVHTVLQDEMMILPAYLS